MGLRVSLLHWYYERAAKGKCYDEWLQRLQTNEATVYDRLVNATELSSNRKTVIHVIGIERWSTHRLRVLLGEPLIIDEYDGYAPSPQTSMEELASQFKATRAVTKSVVRELQSKGIPLTQEVIHNEVGEMSAGAWFFYIENHIGRETVLLVQRLWHRQKTAEGS